MERTGKDIYIIDSTLRDGEQAPGVAFCRRDKLQLSEMLAEAGVDDLAAAATLGTHGVHISFPVSAPLLKTIGKDESWVFETLEKLVPQACREFEQVSVGALDATRADVKWIWHFAEAAASLGAMRLRIADTVGIASPVQVMRLVRLIRAAAKGMVVEFHGHNDLGMATANALSAVQAGAQAVSVTVNGLGERAGNAPLEEIALALPLAAGASCRIKPENLQALCSFVARHSGRSIPPDKPVTGSLIFTHESGIHRHGLLQNDLSYQPYPPQTVGCRTRLHAGKHSGRRALRQSAEG